MFPCLTMQGRAEACEFNGYELGSRREMSADPRQIGSMAGKGKEEMGSEPILPREISVALSSPLLGLSLEYFR